MMKDRYRFIPSGLWTALWLGALLGLAIPATAQVETKLLPGDGDAEDAFGITVSLHGSRAVAGAYQDDNKGSAYVFTHNGTRWSQEAKLTASDGASLDRFGSAMAQHGDRIIVGASGQDGVGFGAGAAYIFRADGNAWVEEAKLMAGDPASEARFGSALSMRADRVLVGASRDDDAGEGTGAVYVFDFDGATWTETAKLTASDAAAKDRFGASVSLDGARALVGAYLNDDSGSASGSAYVFEFNGSTWTETAKLTASDADFGDQFGYTVSLDGDWAFVGAPNDDAEAGSVYVFRFDGTAWVQEAKLTASDDDINDNFGVSVSLSGAQALIGAWGNRDAGLVTGSAYIFAYNGSAWTQETKLLADDAAAGDGFGLSVSLDGEAMMIGAFGDDEFGETSGSAYIYDPMRTVAVDEEAGVPTTYTLYANYPNPFNPETQIRFDLPQATHARLSIYDMMSREVARLFDQPLRAGAHTVTWNAEGLPSGVYVYRLEAGTYSATRTMVLFR